MYVPISPTNFSAMAISSSRIIFVQAIWALTSSSPNLRGLIVAFRVEDVKLVGNGRTAKLEICGASTMTGGGAGEYDEEDDDGDDDDDDDDDDG